MPTPVPAAIPTVLQVMRRQYKTTIFHVEVQAFFQWFVCNLLVGFFFRIFLRHVEWPGQGSGFVTR